MAEETKEEAKVEKTEAPKKSTARKPKAEEEKKVERTALGDAFAEALLTGSPAHKGYEGLSAEERKLRIDEDLKRQSDARK